MFHGFGNRPITSKQTLKNQKTFFSKANYKNGYFFFSKTQNMQKKKYFLSKLSLQAESLYCWKTQVQSNNSKNPLLIFRTWACYLLLYLCHTQESLQTCRDEQASTHRQKKFLHWTSHFEALMPFKWQHTSHTGKVVPKISAPFVSENCQFLGESSRSFPWKLKILLF